MRLDVQKGTHFENIVSQGSLTMQLPTMTGYDDSRLNGNALFESHNLHCRAENG